MNTAAGLHRLSPFDPLVRETIQDIYDDLARYSSFNGITFGADATLNAYEDTSAAALAVYQSWGLPRRHCADSRIG